MINWTNKIIWENVEVDNDNMSFISVGELIRMSKEYIREVINNKDDFEPKLSKEIKEAEVINSVVEQIKEVTDFVDELNLSNDLFKVNTDSIVEEDNKSNK